MKVSELIEALQEILEVDGDLPVACRDVRHDRTFEIEALQIDKVRNLVILE